MNVLSSQENSRKNVVAQSSEALAWTSGIAVGGFSLALSVAARITYCSCPAVSVTRCLLIGISVSVTIQNLP